MSKSQVLDQDGNTIAFLFNDPRCADERANPSCKKAVRTGKPWHIMPWYTDPRSIRYTLAMRRHHFATEEEAIHALEVAWHTGIIVETVEGRDAVYRSGNDPVLIDRNGGPWH